MRTQTRGTDCWSILLDLLRSGNWEQADKLLESQDQSNFDVRKMLMYLEGKKALLQQDYASALTLYKQAQTEYGDHHLLIADLASVYYLTQHYGQWKACLDDAFVRFDDEGQDYSESIQDRLRILMAKFSEEAGELLQAERFLLQSLNSSNQQMVRRARTHLLRLWSQYKMNSKVQEYYLNLKLTNPELQDNEYIFEHAHAMALAEAELSTPDLAIKSLAQLSNCDPSSKSRIAFDLAEIEFRQKGQVSETLWQWISLIEPSHLYEEKLLKIWRGESPADWYLWSSKMPLGNFLSLLTLLMASPDFKEYDLAFHQWKLIVSAMPKKNQALWTQILPTAKVRPARPSVALSDDGELRINQVQIALSSKPLLINFIRLLVEYPKIKDEKACQLLWQSEATESYLARLRQLNGRINKLALQNAAPEICSYRQGVLQLLANVVN